MRYFKMNGCGNDFVIFDARAYGALNLSPEQARAIADRRTGVGCDQVIALETSIRGDAFMRIWNADGEEVSACGNAARCVGWILGSEGLARPVKIETKAGLLTATGAGENRVTVDMGSPLLKWEEIPVARATDTVRMDYAAPGPWGLTGPGGVNMGNPHAVFAVDDVDALPVHKIGPLVERDPFFPEGVNVGFVSVRGARSLRLRVWERGAGLTKACGTGACAAVVAASRMGLVDRYAELQLDGGVLELEWRAKDDHVIMTGPVELEGEDDLVSPAG
ncbi:MAG: diaminopimelate epimerase [Alphaproteobacteria bacterium]|nr:diaminopimelate epimerase [Alphaproteobacteria bacterium]